MCYSLLGESGIYSFIRSVSIGQRACTFWYQRGWVARTYSIQGRWELRSWTQNEREEGQIKAWIRLLSMIAMDSRVNEGLAVGGRRTRRRQIVEAFEGRLLGDRCNEVGTKDNDAQVERKTNGD